MVLVPVRCPHCDREQAIKRGKTENGKPRYLRQQPNCPAKTFILDYAYQGAVSTLKCNGRV